MLIVTVSILELSDKLKKKFLSTVLWIASFSLPADKLYAEPCSDLGDLGSLVGLSGLRLLRYKVVGPPHSPLPEPHVF